MTRASIVLEYLEPEKIHRQSVIAIPPSSSRLMINALLSASIFSGRCYAALLVSNDLDAAKHLQALYDYCKDINLHSDLESYSSTKRNHAWR
jgi:hypothetical protein